MPQKVLRFTGINRKANEFNSQGTCEELVNLRPEVGGFSVVKPKKELPSMGSYSFIYEHSFGDTTNLITTIEGGVFWVKEDGNKEVITYDLKYEDNAVNICSAGNVLLAYSEALGEQKAFKFENGKYNPYNFNLRPITGVSMNYSYDYSSPYEYKYSVIAGDNSITAYRAALATAASGFYSVYPNGLCGAAIVGCSYELEDGSETWSTAFIVASAQRTMNSSVKPNANTEERKVTVYGVEKAWLSISFGEGETRGVKRINVYASRPVYPHDVARVNSTSVTFSDTSLEDLKLDGQIMYYQGSISPEENEAELLLNFSATQVGGALMKVTPGCIERVGDVIAYNNRFHYFRSETKHVVQAPSVSGEVASRVSGGKTYMPYALIGDKYIKINTSFRLTTGDAHDFIYPMAGIKKLAFVEATVSNGVSRPIFTEDMFVVNLRDSSAYNYSYAFDIVPKCGYDAEVYENIKSGGQGADYPFLRDVIWKKEYNAINVSEQYNPFVFPVNYSYSFAGEIKDIVSSYNPISATQIGQYPVSVFTTNGIFALEQSNGTSLYGSVIPIQPLVIDGKSKATPYGIVFISSKNLYLLNGREAISVSDMMRGKLDMEIRNAGGYSSLIYGDESYFGELLSDIDFESFIAHAVLTYDPLHNELIISSDYRYEELGKGQNYSYVFNFNTKAFHKIAGQFLPSQNGAKYVLEYNNGNTRLLNLTEEVETDPVKVMLQSRPFSYEAFYTHINRLIMLTDANLLKDRNIAITVFGSDNLHDWKCIISAQKKNTVLRQIRTNRAAKSYRDYVILITGCVNTDTDISDIIADYSVVNRKLG